MDQSRRPRPPQGNSICPLCSVSHFPFCPQRQFYDQNPRFGSDANHGFHRPYFDPYNDYNNWGNHQLPQTVHRNPNFAGDSVIVVNSGYHRFEHDRLGLNSGEVSGNDRTSKRFKVDDVGSGLAVNGNWQSQSGVDNERRLKLIRDHGIQSGANFANHSMRGYSQDNFSDRNLSASASGKHLEFDGSRNVGHNTARNEMNPGFGSYDWEGAFVHSEPYGINRENHEKREFWRDEHKHMPSRRDGCQSDMDQSYGGNRNGGFLHPQKEGFQQFRYGQTENSFPLPSQNYGSYGPNSVGHEWVKKQFPGMEKGDINQQPYMSQNINSGENEFPSDNFCSHNIKQLQDEDSTQYSRQNHAQVLPGSTATYVQAYALSNNKYDNNRSDELWNGRESAEVRHHVPPHVINTASHLPMHATGSVFPEAGLMPDSHPFNFQPPLPATPPPPLPMAPQDPPLALQKAPSPPKTSVTLFPVPIGSASGLSSHPSISEGHSFTQPLLYSTTHAQAPSGFGPKSGVTTFHRRCIGAFSDVSHSFHQTPVKQPLGQCQQFPMRNQSSDKPKAVDASQLFLQPHRATRPDHFVIILRGLPGSGKSYLAKVLRDTEVENGGDAPRIHSMDDYFMTEVDKVEETEAAKSSARGKRPIVKKVLEYCYEPEMEEAYRSSMLKAFKKTLEDGVFTFIIVDDRNLRVADFAQFWATAKRSGYEVYLLEAPYKDPVGCAARNVHGFSQGEIQKMAAQWEEAPSLYLQLDIKSMLKGDDLKECGIQEVDMDTDDGNCDEGEPVWPETKSEKVGPLVGISIGGETWNPEGHLKDEVKELGRSKWSDDLDENDTENAEVPKLNSNSLSGLLQAYHKEGKSVHWGDQDANTGFSIGAKRKTTAFSLVIGPGAGYNLKSNPLPVDENPIASQNKGEPKRESVFQERLRAERESFRAVFDRRRQRIRGLDVDDE
ncbi:hypothetical protein RJ641_014502 [Dillenia turbinata]|uniref:YLP motif-containing protein 1 n=1 Tax=Dillenia turbinata TaxID=194707 RepID=A0AAN8UX58_9MAGN